MTHKYKVGDKLVPKKGCEDECMNYKEYKGNYIVISCLYDNDKYGYEIFDSKNLKVISCMTCFSDKSLTTLEKSWDNFDVGDIIDCGEGYEKKVLFRAGDLFIPSMTSNHEKSDVPFTVCEAKERGWTIVNNYPAPTEEVQEMTVEEVSKLVGKKVKIVE